MSSRDLAKCVGITFLLLVITTGAWSQERADAAPPLPEEPARFFDLKIPQGFKPEAVDEPGILRWKKDEGEIYAVMGELFSNSAEGFLNVLHKAAEKDKNLIEVKSMRLKGGRALLFKEKPRDEPNRLRNWRVLLVADKKVLSVDFTAPEKDFNSFVPAFEQTIKSLKVKPRS